MKAPAAKAVPAAAEKKGPVKKSKAAPVKKKAQPLDLKLPKDARKSKLPGFIEPYLASLSERPPSGAGWLHEIKFDGYRLQAEIDNGRITLRTRRGLDWTGKFRGIANELATLPIETALIDGEALVEDAAGISDFSGLQNALSEGHEEKIVFYGFDLLYIDGYDLRGVPLRERKRVLADLLAARGDSARIRYSNDFDVGGDRLLQHVCRLGAEGIISKRADEPYRSGRAKGWLKAKCADRQEFVIAGYVPSTTSPKAIGSLIAAYHDDKGRLMHAGRVGTGYSMKLAQQLFKLLDPSRVHKPPFPDPLPAEARRDARFVEPKHVMEVAFRGWTAGGQIRQAAFKGLREDKPLQEVVRESTGRVSDPQPSKAIPAIHLTHADRVLWPEAGITKQGLADYYVSVWDWIEPHIVKRPLSLVRCPTGISEGCFFQKHEWKGMDRAIDLVRDPKDGEKLVSVSNLQGLLALVQASALEIHPWGSTGDDLEHPDRLIFDLDPGEGVAFADMIAGANEIRGRLAAMKLESFVKTSGGKGLHVVVPLTPSAGWEEAKEFCRIVAENMERDSPRLYTSTVTKRERKGKIYVDYLRNGRGATAIAPYSSRARAEAGVGTPLAWEELPSLHGCQPLHAGQYREPDGAAWRRSVGRDRQNQADAAESESCCAARGGATQARAGLTKAPPPHFNENARGRVRMEASEKSHDVLVIGGGNAALCAAISGAPRRRIRARARRRAEILSRRQHAPHPQHALRPRFRHRDAERTLQRRRIFRRSDARHAGAHGRRPRALHDRQSKEISNWIPEQGVRFQPSLGGTLSLGRTNSFFLGGGRSMLNALYLTAEKLGVDDPLRRRGDRSRHRKWHVPLRHGEERRRADTYPRATLVAAARRL